MKYLRQLALVVMLAFVASIGSTPLVQAATKTTSKPKTAVSSKSKAPMHKMTTKSMKPMKSTKSMKPLKSTKSTKPAMVTKGKKPVTTVPAGKGPGKTTKKSSHVKSVSKAKPGGPVHVKGYYKKNGTYVKPYTRKAPAAK